MQRRNSNSNFFTFFNSNMLKDVDVYIGISQYEYEQEQKEKGPVNPAAVSSTVASPPLARKNPFKLDFLNTSSEENKFLNSINSEESGIELTNFANKV